MNTGTLSCIRIQTYTTKCTNKPAVIIYLHSGLHLVWCPIANIYKIANDSVNRQNCREILFSIYFVCKLSYMNGICGSHMMYSTKSNTKHFKLISLPILSSCFTLQFSHLPVIHGVGCFHQYMNLCNIWLIYKLICFTGSKSVFVSCVNIDSNHISLPSAKLTFCTR